MRQRNPLVNLRFASKIVMLVGLMGLVTVAVAAYTLAHTRSISQQYSHLLAHEARGALIIAEATQHLGNASRVAYTVLTEPDEVRMLAQLDTLDATERKYTAELQSYQTLLPTLSSDVEAIMAQSQQIFDMVRRIIRSSASWRGDRALQIIDTEFEPALAVLRRDTDALRDQSVARFTQTSSELGHQTEKAIIATASAIAGALVLVIALSVYVAITQMSRPLALLTRSMERMSERHYGEAIELTTRRDEVGKMANALQVFQQSMQREDRLEVTAATLAKAKELAEQTAAEKARFLATMSHEIRTPLNAMLGMTQLALRHEAVDAQRERMHNALLAGKHLLGIVNDVLDLSKIEAGKMDMVMEEFSLQSWVKEVHEWVGQDALDKGLELQWVVEQGVPDGLRGSRQRMGQILLNYLHNAIKFTPAGAITVTLSAKPVADGDLLLTCAVHDTGIGISAQDQAKLFTAFVQADDSLTRRFGGTGLGLVISRQLAHLLGGEAGVTSAPGHGSTFWFTAKVSVSTNAGIADAAPPPGALGHYLHAGRAAPALQGVRVLLVDDNDINRAVAHGMLQMGGVQVDEAADGAQALALLRQAPVGTYALVLMDMQMPVMDGMTATRALRENTAFADLPVIALTANASESDKQRTRAAGMDDHLAKPLLEDALWRCIERWARPATSRTDGTALAPDPHPRQVSPVDGSPPPHKAVGLEALSQVDTVALDDLREALGPDRAQDLTLNFLRETEARLARMQALTMPMESADWAALMKEAHVLSGNAGSFGLVRLGNIAQRVYTDAHARNAVDLEQTLEHLVRCAALDLAALQVLTPHSIQAQSTLGA